MLMKDTFKQRLAGTGGLTHGESLQQPVWPMVELAAADRVEADLQLSHESRKGEELGDESLCPAHVSMDSAWLRALQEAVTTVLSLAISGVAAGPTPWLDMQQSTGMGEENKPPFVWSASLSP